MNASTVVRTLMVVAIVLPTCLGARALQGDRGQAPGAGAPASGGPAGRGPLPAPRPAGIDFATAQKMVAAAEAAAKIANNKVAIAVVDVNGDLVAFERMDGATAQAVTSSQGKARAAILFGVPTKQVQDAAAAGTPISVSVTMPQGGPADLTPFQGGIPIIKDGKVVAGIGVGGAPPANDEKFAIAGRDAAK
jgi:glc operon protein GlcG